MRITSPRQPATAEEIAAAVDAACGRRPGSLLLQNVRLVNVYSAEIYEADVLLAGRLIAGVGHGFAAEQVLDLAGYTLLPGLIDGHMHLESSLVEALEYARAVVPRGVTAVVCDPHEIANVLGLEGVRYILRSAAGLPLDVFATASSCVPATALETAGAAFGLDEIATVLDLPEVVGVAELMNFPGIVAGDPDQLAKAFLAETRGLVADGHAPGLTGPGLHAYAVAGVRSDHECITAEEAVEKLRAGLTVMIREASGAHNLEALLPAVTTANSDRFLLVTDDVLPHDLVRQGGVDHAVRRAVARGLDPITAVQMATLNPARYFGLARRGAVAPGHLADLVAVEDLQELRAHLVFKEGRLVARDGELLASLPGRRDGAVRDTVRLPALTPDRLALHHAGGPARVIGLMPGQITTRQLIVTPKVERGQAVPDPERDLAKLVVIERHGRSGRVGAGLVNGFGLTRGALASTVAHDSHNLVACGMNDADILVAARALAECGGGFAVADGGRVLARLPLPVAGLMSTESLEVVIAGLDDLNAAARALGVQLENPFMALSFLALPVIPELKLTDAGLVDVARGQVVPLAV